MSKKDIGWDYLNSEGMDSISENDDSLIYTHADGSNSYYGNDGSWGYKNSDGSGSYYGSDGSWGYTNSDGSMSYYGADGSWGYKNADGSGSYYGNDNSSTYYDSHADDEKDDTDEDDDDDSSNTGIGLAAWLAVLAVGLGATAYEKYKSEEAEKEKIEETRRKEIEKIKKENQAIKNKEKALRKKRAKALLLKRKKLQIDFSTNDLIGKHFEYVLNVLKENGFNNYKAIAVKDIYVNNNYSCGEVSQVVINSKSSVDKYDMIPYDAEITVTYHLKKEIIFPYSSHRMIRRNYQELSQELLDLGYTEIYTHPITDLKTGWITKDGAVEKVSIGGNVIFKKLIPIEYDTKIIIEYHTFKK